MNPMFCVLLKIYIHCQVIFPDFFPSQRTPSCSFHLCHFESGDVIITLGPYYRRVPN